ncbi:MAG TPA: DedA family protein [Xanthobacteraceae bacterium]|jgi:membrane protein DedA with SNARE-associated domain|nr:DedA family protein [Xanthobacteraceae bacterium]
MPELGPLIAHYGYAAVGVVVGLESMGVPLPGETMLVVSAIYAGTHSDLHIAGVIGAAAVGAILGDNVGYWLGREFGYPLLLRYGRYVGLSQTRIKLGQYLFQRHGGKVVFFGRFIAVLRVLAAFLAGVNRMEWKSFLLANAAGGVIWSLVYGLGAYLFGAALFHAHRSVSIALVIVGLVIVAVAFRYVRAHEAELERQAELALPGPLRPVDWLRRRLGD